jgi:hypothetical protein
MPKIKYDLRDVEAAGGSFEAPPPGLYRAKLAECNQKKSKSGNDMLECVYELTRGDFKGSKVWDYIVIGVEGFPERKLRQFLEAVGHITGKKNAKGGFDPDEFEDTEVQLRLKNETYDDEPRARVAAVLPLPEDDEDEEEIEAEEPDAEDDDEEGDGEEYTYEDIAEMDLADLKEVIEEEELGIRVTKKSKVETVLAKVAEALELEPEEEEEEEDDEDGDEVEYEDMTPEELKAECKDRGLKAAGKKAVLIARLEKDDEEAEDPFE